MEFNADIKQKQGMSEWMAENWRSLAFLVYFVICMFDFVIMPGVYESLNRHIDAPEVLRMALQFSDPQVQMEIIRQLTNKRAWVPLTMDGAAAFHLAFGAILTGAAWQRGQEKIEHIRTNRVRNSSRKPDNPDD